MFLNPKPYVEAPGGLSKYVTSSVTSTLNGEIPQL